MLWTPSKLLKDKLIKGRLNKDGLITDEAGVTAIEYGLIAALVAVVIIAAVTALGTSLSTLFSTVANTI